jgi:hypothetical protein
MQARAWIVGVRRGFDYHVYGRGTGLKIRRQSMTSDTLAGPRRESEHSMSATETLAALRGALLS